MPCLRDCAMQLLTLNYLFIHLKVMGRERETGCRRWDLQHWFIPQRIVTVRNQALHPRLPHGGRDPVGTRSTLVSMWVAGTEPLNLYHCCLPGVHEQEAGGGSQQPVHSAGDRGCSQPNVFMLGQTLVLALEFL